MGERFSADAVVVGAGPAGLGAALGLARKGMDVAVLDMQDRIGSRRRGETIRFDREMDAHLGKGFFERQTIRTIRKRSYFSHTGLRRVDRTIKNPNCIISWPDFIRSMADVVKAAGARIIPASTVVGFLEEKGRITGVRAMVGGFMQEEIRAGMVFSCGGCEDPASLFLNIDRTGMDMPVSKRLVRGYAGPDERFEYHLHIQGDTLTVGTIFPRTHGEAEFILLSYAKGRKPQAMTFEEFAGAHNLFRERLEGCEAFYTLKTAIPMGKMVFPCCPRDGLVMAGDALGHVQARGGSGIKTSFLMGYAAGTLGAEALTAGKWTSATRQMLEQAMRNSPHTRRLRMHNLIYSTLRAGIFGRIRSPREMDRLWPVLSVALR
ncbi:MAG TPA: FAD-dependent oxidoreductase [Deltaproteobacteria bacterium]|nr:FAD-dependent oxidoreductase [Deltaproteobacteria bacterium]